MDRLAGRQESVLPGAGLPDEELARRVRAGETALFEVLMRRLNARVYRAVRSVLREEDVVEEVMQEAYVRAFTHLHQFAGESRFSTWMVRVAINEALMRVRKEARLRLVSAPEPLDEEVHMAPQHSPEQRAEARELACLLEHAIDGLPEHYRTVFVLREVEGLSTQETAEAVGLNEAAVKTRLHRARGLVRDALYARLGASAPEVFSFHASRCDRVVAGVLARLGAGTGGDMPG